MPMERICWNCNNFFPEKESGPTEMGICINEKAFEPYLEELMENANYNCCRELIEREYRQYIFHQGIDHQ